MNRRSFLKAAGAALPVAGAGFAADAMQVPFRQSREARLRISCNLFSFNEPLTSGEMSLEEVLDFCSDLGFDAVDPTGYYFPGYPAVPDDAYLYRIKQHAFKLGLDISGTGVRNDFTVAPDRLPAEIDLVKNWVRFAQKFGAPSVRVFAGLAEREPQTVARITQQLIGALKEATAYGARHGVLIALQDHWDFLRTADQVLEVFHAVDSEWIGLNVDIGSFRIGDPYEEIAKVAPYAVNWQVKETVYVGGEEVKTDVDRIVQIIRASGYRGYVPIETLGSGDPRPKVRALYGELKEAIEA